MKKAKQEKGRGPYLARRLEDGKYLAAGRKTKFTDNHNEARVFTRLCDLRNAMKGPHSEGGYEPIPCLVQPDLKFRVYPARAGAYMRDDEERFFPTLELANLYADMLAYKRCAHRDYFKVEQTTKEVNTESLDHVRPDWKDYLMGLAFIVARRSHDAQRQHGCIITDSLNRILGTGYNGFPRGLKDKALPNKRPEKPGDPSKYNWMIHAEVNAASNCLVRPVDAVAYITCEPCNPCLFHLWQNGITKVVHPRIRSSTFTNAETRKVFDDFVEQTGMIVEIYTPDLSWIAALAADIAKLTGVHNASNRNGAFL